MARKQAYAATAQRKKKQNKVTSFRQSWSCCMASMLRNLLQSKYLTHTHRILYNNQQAWSIAACLPQTFADGPVWWFY